MSSVLVLIRLSVVTNGNNNLMPTISPFGISDKTLISQNICASKEFECIYKDFYVHIHIMNVEISYKQVFPLFLLCWNIPAIYISVPLFVINIISYISFLLLSEFLPLYLITNISPPFCHQCQRTMYKYNNYKVTPKWDRKSWCTFKIVEKVLSHESCKIWHVERAI